MEDIEKNIDDYVEFLKTFNDDIKNSKSTDEKLASFFAFKFVESVLCKEIIKNLKENEKSEGDIKDE